MRHRRTIVCLATAIALLIVGFRVDTVHASHFRPCHDDSKMRHHFTHGDPSKGLKGSKSGDHGYYYLSITAGCAGDNPLLPVTLIGKVHLDRVVKGKLDAEGMCWRLDITEGYNHKHKLLLANLMGNTVILIFRHAVFGHHYRFRIANMESGVTVTDHASFDG